MSTLESGGSVAEFLEGFRRYVREPLTGARQAVEQEQEELTTEIDAFEAFTERLASIELSNHQAGHLPTSTLVQAESQTESVKKIRTGYQETVMAVDHYDKAYGEPLEKHFIDEFGPDLGCHITTEESSTITPQYLNALKAGCQNAIHTRKSFYELLEREQTSIQRADDVITELAGQCSETKIPEWYQEEFIDRLSQLTEDRQEQIRTYSFDSDCGGHELCSYLYEEESSTYPVLAAIGRLRSVVRL